MSAKILRFAAVFMVLAVLLTATAYSLSADVVMKVSRTAQDSIVNEGEDLDIDVVLDEVSPSSFRWYFNDELIPGAERGSYTITAAKVEDAGNYRLEAYDDEGAMLVSVEFSVRVIAKELPKSGDSTLGIGAVIAMMGLLGAVMTGAIARAKRRAA